MFAPRGANSPPARQSRAIRIDFGGPAGPPNLPVRVCQQSEPVPDAGQALQLVGKARLRRPFPPKHVSPAPAARPGKRARKPCYARLSLSKKSAYGGLFRQMLKKCLRPGAQTPRPPGKAGRYESTLEGLRALQTSRKVFVSSLKPCYARLPNPPRMSLDSDFTRRACGPSEPLGRIL